MIKRLFDIMAAATLLVCFSPALVAIAIAVRATSPGPALFWSQRAGMNSRLFAMPKFRSMRTGTPQLATHLLDGSMHVTPLGRTLRRLSLDELPQLWSVLKGDMSLVGPRPALFNQHDLIAARRSLGVDRLRPGITGWAQINGRDELELDEKVLLDREYLEHQSFMFDLKIMWLSIGKAAGAQDVRH